MAQAVTMEVADVRKDPALLDELQRAFENAFATRDSLRHFVRHRLGRNLEKLSAGGTIDVLIGDLIYKEDEGDGWLVDLVQAAYRHCPQNALLRDFSSKVGWLPPETLPGLQDIAAVPENRGILRLYRREISGSCRWAYAVGDLKDMHDQLDTLRHRVYEPLKQVQPRIPMPDAMLELGGYAEQFDTILSKLKKAASGKHFPRGSFPWIEDELVPAWEWLGRTQAEERSEYLSRVIALIKGVIEKELTALDRSLADATRELNLSELVETLESLQDRLQDEGAEPLQVSALGGDVETLRGMESRVSQLLESHHRWQRVDAQVNYLEASLNQTLDGIVISFELLQKQLDRLQPADGIDQWRDAAAALAAAVDSRTIPDVWKKFTPLAARLRLRFFEVDQDLLQECERIRSTGGSLSTVLEKLDA